MKRMLLLFCIYFFLNSSNAQKPGYANLHILDPYNPEFVPGEILVKFKDDVIVKVRNTKSQPQTGVKSIDDFIVKHGIKTCTKVFNSEERRKDKSFIKLPDGQNIEVPQLFNIYKFTADSKADVKMLASALKAEPEVEFAEPNYYFYSQATEPNDPMASQQWYLGAFPGVNAKAAWDTTTGDTTQIIGIIDTGVDWTHPDLSPNIWTNWDEIPGNGVDDDGNGKIDDRRGWDFINNDNNPMDDNSHGTHVAGIAAAKGNNSIGIAGIAWNSKIMPIKVMQSSGFGSSSDIANGVNYARLNGATILNLSIGSYGESLTLKTALENAYSTAVIVAAAGNDGYKIDPPYPPPPVYKPMFPACYPWVLGVMATGQSGGLSGFSNFDPSGPVVYTNSYGHNYEISTPGVSILSTFPNGGYHLLNGTSMAAPIVSGAVALIKSQNPTLTTEELFARLIQSSNNNVLNISGAMNIILIPDLCFQAFTLIDTLPGCDNDGVADAGETIQLFIKVKNAGGLADSVWSKIRFAPFEDTTVATIIDSTSYIGDISSYGSMTGLPDPFKIYVKPTTANNRDIMLQYVIGCKTSNLRKIGTILLKVHKGVELKGLIDTSLILYPTNEYIVSNHLIVNYGDTLTILPGTILRIADNKKITIWGVINALGKVDSIIQFLPINESCGQFEVNSGSFEYSQFKNIDSDGHCFNITSNNVSFNNCSFVENSASWALFNLNYSIPLHYCVFTKNSSPIFQFLGENLNLHHSNVVNNFCLNSPIIINSSPVGWIGNNIMNNNFYDIKTFPSSTGVIYLTTYTYYGYAAVSSVQSRMCDYFTSGQGGVISLTNYAEEPDSVAHGIVWKVLIDSICINKLDNPYNASNGLGVVGPGLHRFEVYFNRPMDISRTPLLTFGVREPYTQRIVSDSAFWNSDSTRWTAFYTVGIETGDGIQRVRVEGARDTEHFEIPIEDSRFEFVIQAAGSASIEFMATPGIGKVYLEWNRAGTEDALGYNMYRYFNITDSTFSAPIRINSSLITDTLFTDFGVIPDSTYHYYYKVVGTDLQESDSSKIIVTVPLAAANGDANGDMTVSVLDITAVIAYMLNQNPQPFLFDAADVNSDNTINVLDVIGIVDIILGKKKSVSSTITSNPNPAHIYLDKDRIRLKSDGQVAAMQFELAGQNTEQVRLIMKQQGFEFATGIVNGKLMGIIYNLGNRTLSSGMIDLVGIEGVSKPLGWGDVTAGDPQGQYVLVLKNEKDPMTLSATELTANPNPFKDRVTITYRLIEQASIQLEIFDSEGKLTKALESAKKPEGSYSIEWDGKNVASGLYYCRLTGTTLSGQKLKSEIKIMMTK